MLIYQIVTVFVNDLFQNFRPDIAVLKNNMITILELIVCHELNLTKSKKQYKVSKYSSNISSSNLLPLLIATLSVYC